MKTDNLLLWNALKQHIGHQVEIASYGDGECLCDVCLECIDCGEIILDAELYTLCTRGDLDEEN